MKNPIISSRLQHAFEKIKEQTPADVIIDHEARIHQLEQSDATELYEQLKTLRGRFGLLSEQLEEIQEQIAFINQRLGPPE